MNRIFPENQFDPVDIQRLPADIKRNCLASYTAAGIVAVNDICAQECGTIIN